MKCRRTYVINIVLFKNIAVLANIANIGSDFGRVKDLGYNDFYCRSNHNIRRKTSTIIGAEVSQNGGNIAVSAEVNWKVRLLA